MKILLLIPSLAASDGGTSRTVPALAAALARIGVNADVVTTDANGPEKLDAPRRRWIEREGYRLQYFPRSNRREYKLSFSLLVWLLRHAGDYDVVHINSDFNFPVLAAALACRVWRVPYLLTPHGMLEPWALQYKVWKKRAYYSLLERPLVLRGARAIQALNAHEAENLRALNLGPAIVVLPNGIDPGQAASQDDPGDKAEFLARFPAARDRTRILFLHRIDPKKGLDLLADAYAEARREFPQIHLIVAGPDNVGFTATARGFFERAGCGEAQDVTFTGMLEGALKRGAVAAADIFVAPSYSEGFSMSVLEAMAAGLPCVLTVGCNFPEAAEAGAARVTGADAGEFSAALRGLLAAPDAAQAMGERARALVLADYTWDKIAARFQSLCAELTTKPSPSARFLPL